MTAPAPQCQPSIAKLADHVIEIRQRDLEKLESRVQELEAALKDTLNMLRAAHMQLGMWHDSNKRVIKARAALQTGGAKG